MANRVSGLRIKNPFRLIHGPVHMLMPGTQKIIYNCGFRADNKVRNTHTIRTKTVDVNGDTLILERLIIGMDGIRVEGKLEFNSETKGFTFWSPKKSSENHKLIELLFVLMNENFQKDSTIKVCLCSFLDRHCPGGH